MLRQVGPPPKIRVPPNIFDQLKEQGLGQQSQQSYPRFQGGGNTSNERLYESSNNNMIQTDRLPSGRDMIDTNYNSQTPSQNIPERLSYAAPTNIRKAFDDDVEREMRILEANMKQLVSGTGKEEIPSSTSRYDSYEQASSNKYHNNYEPASSSKYDSYKQAPSSKYDSYEPQSNRPMNYEQLNYDNYQSMYNEQDQNPPRHEYQDERNEQQYQEYQSQPLRQQERVSSAGTGQTVRRKGGGILNLYKSPTDGGRDEKAFQQMKYAQQLKEQVDERNQLGDTNNGSRQRKGDIIDISYSDGYDNSKYPPPSADILRDMYGINPSKIQSSPPKGMLFGLDQDSERNLKRAKQEEYRRQLDNESRKPISESPLKKSPSFTNQHVQYQEVDMPVMEERYRPSEKDIKRAKQEEYRRQLDYESAESKRLQREETSNRQTSVKNPPVVEPPPSQSGLMIGAMKIDPREALISRRYGQNEYADLLKQDARYGNQETPTRGPPSFSAYEYAQVENLPVSSEKNSYVPDAMAVLKEEKALEMLKRRQQQDEYRAMLDQQVKNKNTPPIESKINPPVDSKLSVIAGYRDESQQQFYQSKYQDPQYYNSSRSEQTVSKQYDHYDDQYTQQQHDLYQQSYLQQQAYPPQVDIHAGQYEKSHAGQYEQTYQQASDFQHQANTQKITHTQISEESGKTPVKTLARNRLINDVYGSQGIVLEVSPEMQAGWRPSKKITDDRTKAAQMEQKAALEKQIAEDRKRKDDEAMEIKLREEREEEKVRAELAALNQKEIRNKELKKAQEYEQIMATKALQDKIAQDALSRKNKARSPNVQNSPQRLVGGENPRVIHTPPFQGSPSRLNTHKNLPVNSPPRVVMAPPPRREYHEQNANTSQQYIQRDASREEINPNKWNDTMNSSYSHMQDSQYMPRNSYRQELQRPGTAEINKYLSDWQRNSQERLDNMIQDRNNFQNNRQQRNYYQDYQEEDISFVSESRLVPANPYDQSGLISALRPLGSSIERINFQNDDPPNRSFSQNTPRRQYRESEDIVEKSLNADSFLIYLDKNKATPLKSSSSPFGTDIAITESFVASSRSRPSSGKPSGSLLEKFSHSDEKERALTGHGNHNSRTPGGRPYNRIDDDDYTEDESDEIIVAQTSPTKKVISTPPRSQADIRSRPLSSMSPGEFRRPNSGSKAQSLSKSKEESFIVMSPTKEERMAMLETSLKDPLTSPLKTIKPTDSVYQSAAMQEFMSKPQSVASIESPASHEESKWRVTSKDKVDTILQLQKRSYANDNMNTMNTIDGYADSFEEEDDDDELIRKYLKKEQIDFDTTMDSKIDSFIFEDKELELTTI